MSVSKPFRIFSFLLLVLFLLPVFSVGVSAASDNLIDPNVMNWSHTSDSTLNEVWSNGGVSYIKVYPESTDLGNLLVKSYTFYDLSNLKAGRSYTFSFHLLNLDEACRLDNTIIWDNYYGGLANGGFYVIGLGSWDSASNTVTAVEGSCVTINSSNFASLYGTDIDISFEFNNLINPCIFIYYGEMSEYPSTQCLLVSNLQLIDNDSAEEEGFFKRLFEWFEIRFNNLGNNFSELGNRISGFFSNLSSDISSGFSDLRDKLNEKLDETAKKFTDFFDKFKPRVHVNLDWSRGSINVNGDIIQAGNSNFPMIIVSELFEVPSGSTYFVSYKKFDSSLASGASIFQYDLSGNYIGLLYQSNVPIEEYELPSGYMYRFRQSWTRSIDVDDDVANQHFSVYCDSGWLNALLFNFKSMIKGLFVPSETDINEWKLQLESLLSDNLGFIYQVPDLFTNLVTKLRSILVRDDFSFSIKLPQLDFNLFGHDAVLWEEQTVDFSYIFEDGIFKNLYGMYKVALYIIFGFALVKYGWWVLEELMDN